VGTGTGHHSEERLTVVELGTFVLHSFVEPPVTAGRYELHGTQPMTGITVGEHVADVIVSSPRYVMPPDQILSTFPPAMAEGDFGSRLPQIALKRRTLPWERVPGGPPLGANDPPRPWLALVVIAEGEGALSPDPAPVAECVTPGKVLPHAEDADSPTGYYLTVTETVVKKVFPTVEDLPLLVHVREVDIRDTELANGDDDGWLAVVLANRLPIAVPTTDPNTGDPVSAPVRYLACLLNLEGQVDVLPTDAELATDDTFQLVAAVQDLRFVATSAASTDLVVMGSGFPATFTSASRGLAAAPIESRGVVAAGAATPGSNAALATWASPKASATAKATALQPVDAGVAVRKEMAGGWAATASPFVLEKTYRFPVLVHWSFTATNDGDFRSIVQALDVGLLGTQYGTVFSVDPNSGDPSTKVEHVHLPDPKAPPRPDPPELAETGHIALPQTSRRGDAATAWYRGPFGPLPTDRDPPDQPLAHVSDQLRTLTPDGREDVSLAAAFEIGRLLGLSQPALVSALVRWRREQFGAARAHTIGELVTQATAFAPAAARLGSDLGRLVGVQMMTLAGQAPERVAGPARPIVDPGRPIGLDGPLDQVVAAGLGLDLGQLQEQARRRGMVAALADTDVVVASGGRLDQATLTGLRATLDAEVSRVATAAGRRVIGPLGVADEAAPDALDELLDAVQRDEEAGR
jgi:hypothetical protein